MTLRIAELLFYDIFVNRSVLIVNPFKKGSTQYADFETMKDCEWHCTKCELKSGQAKTWQVWRQEKGIQLDTDENGNWFKRLYCEKCKAETIHRKLKSTELESIGLKARNNIPNVIAKRAKNIYNCIDEYTLRTEPANQLEIDHRVPQVRWSSSETDNTNLTDEQIKEKFMLLTRANNLLKSRFCEECKKSGKRAKGYRTIEFWYIGNEKYTDDIGCKGCFWYNPTKWREEINNKIKEK